MIKDKNLDNLEYCDVNNLYGWAMSEKLPVDGFSCVENTSQFNKNFIEIYKADDDERYFLDERYVQYPEKVHDLHNDLPFLSERMNIENIEKIVANLHDKKNMPYT